MFPAKLPIISQPSTVSLRSLSTSFVSTWATTGSDETLTLPFVDDSNTIDFTIDWGDGNTDTVTAYDDDLGEGGIDHVYATADTYTIAMAGTISGFKMANGSQRTKLKTITQWGTFNISTTQVLYGCNGLTAISAEDAPTITATDMTQALSNCTNSALTFGTGLNLWDVSSVTNMTNMFNGCAYFNGDISGWDTGEVTDMTYMFGQVNQSGSMVADLSSWDVSKVTNMTTMFFNCINFNSDISSWNTAAVTNMSSMFYNCDIFNQDIGSWNTAAVTNMTGMFTLAHTFNQDISDWNTAAVTTMDSMFSGCSAFNQDISTDVNKWNVSSVTNLNNTFYNCAAFDGDITNWDVSSVTNMRGLFRYAVEFNQDIGNWETGAVTNMGYMFHVAVKFNRDINTDGNKWNTANCTTFDGMFQNATIFNQDISGWNTVKVTNMTLMFEASGFDQDIGDWNIVALTNATNMFLGRALSTANYDSLLIDWEDNAHNDNVVLHAGSSDPTLGGGAEAARDALVVDGWTITDADGTHT